MGVKTKATKNTGKKRVNMAHVYEQYDGKGKLIEKTVDYQAPLIAGKKGANMAQISERYNGEGELVEKIVSYKTPYVNAFTVAAK